MNRPGSLGRSDHSRRARRDRALRICRITPTFAPRLDGWSRHVTLLSSYQQQLGHDVVVVQPLDARTGDYSFRLVTPRTPLARVPSGKWERRRFAQWASAQALRLPDRPDVLHVHGDVIDVYSAGHAADRLGVPLVLTVHGGLSTALRYRVVARSVLRRPERVIAVGAPIATQLADLGVCAQSVHVISSGIEAARLRTEREVGAAGPLSVLASGRLVPVKGFDCLIKGFIRAQLPRGSSLTILGEGPEREVLNRLATGHPEISLPGELGHEAVLEALKGADVFVMPSVDLPRQREGTPTALMEAMAAGMACVGSDAAGVAALLSDRQTGLLVGQGRPDALAQALETLSADPQLRYDLGRNAVEAVQSRDWPRVAESVVAVYQEALGSPGSHRRP